MADHDEREAETCALDTDATLDTLATLFTDLDDAAAISLLFEIATPFAAAAATPPPRNAPPAA